MADDEATLPLFAETMTVSRRKRVIGKVRVQVVPGARDENVNVDLTDQRVDVERVPVGRFVDAPPAVRVEGDTTIVPVLEERAVVTVRLFLREELRVRTVQTTRTEQRVVSLRTETAEVQHLAPNEGDTHDE